MLKKIIINKEKIIINKEKIIINKKTRLPFSSCFRTRSRGKSFNSLILVSFLI